MSYSMKISKPGIDVLTASDKDLIFTSDRNCLKEKLSGLIDTDSSGNVTIPHNLGYTPSFFIFWADSTNLNVWYPNDGTGYANTTNDVIS